MSNKQDKKTKGVKDTLSPTAGSPMDNFNKALKKIVSVPKDKLQNKPR